MWIYTCKKALKPSNTFSIGNRKFILPQSLSNRCKLTFGIFSTPMDYSNTVMLRLISWVNFQEKNSNRLQASISDKFKIQILIWIDHLQSIQLFKYLYLLPLLPCRYKIKTHHSFFESNAKTICCCRSLIGSNITKQQQYSKKYSNQTIGLKIFKDRCGILLNSNDMDRGSIFW